MFVCATLIFLHSVNYADEAQPQSINFSSVIDVTDIINHHDLQTSLMNEFDPQTDILHLQLVA